MYWYESWTIKKAEHQCWCLQTVVLEETLESSLDCKKIKPVNPKGNQQPWIFVWRTDAETETPILWPPDVVSWLTGKDPDAGKDWGQEEKGTTEDEIVGWHYWLKGQWVWANSGRYWRTGKPGMLQFMELHSIRHDLVIEQRHIYAFIFILYINCHLAFLDKN